MAIDPAHDDDRGSRRAPVDRPILDVLADRWSPRAIDPAAAVDTSEVLVLLEAARWAPSSGNAQPWRYVVFDDTVAEARERARGCLNRGNAWARQAPVLMLSVVVPTWPGSDELNRMALHDVGAASMALCVQGLADGLVVHQMAGFDLAGMRQVAELPDDAEPVAMIAVGRPGDASALPDKLQQRERRPRRRRPLGETATRARYDGPPLA